MRKVTLRAAAKETPEGYFYPVIMTDESDITLNQWALPDYESARARAQYIINQILDADPTTIIAEPVGFYSYSLWLVGHQKSIQMGLLDSESKVETLGQEILRALGVVYYRPDQSDPDMLIDPLIRVRSDDPADPSYVSLADAKEMVRSGRYIVMGPGLIAEREV